MLIIKGINNDNEEYFNTLFKDKKVNIARLWDISIKNKCFSLVGKAIFKYGAYKFMHPLYQNQLKMNLDYTRRKNKIYFDMMKKLGSELQKNKVDYVYTKGIILINDLYEDFECRGLNDIDIIVSKKDKGKIKEILNTLGFIPGTYRLSDNKLVEISHEEQVLYNVTGNKLCGHVKEIKDPFVHSIYVGVDFDFTWSHSEYNVDVNDVLKRRVERSIGENKEKITTMSCHDHFIYIILHLLKHAWSGILAQYNDGATLMQFSDVFRYWNLYKEKLRKELAIYISRYSLFEPVAWVLGHTDRLFHSNIVEELSLDEYATESWLRSIVLKKDKQKEFSGNIMELLL